MFHRQRSPQFLGKQARGTLDNVNNARRVPVLRRPVTNMLDIVNRSFTAADIDALSVTLNIRRKGLEWLTNKDRGANFRSKDRPSDDETDEQVQEQIAAVYDKIGRKPIGDMASLAARCPRGFRYDNNLLTSYGDIVLVMDWLEVASDIVILNGDAKNLGAKLVEARSSGAEQSDSLIWFSFDADHLTAQISSTRTKLDELWTKSMKIRATPPRIVGKYCEARLFRKLRPTDVSKVFIPEVAHSEMSLVEDLERLKQSMRTSIIRK